MFRLARDSCGKDGFFHDISWCSQTAPVIRLESGEAPRPVPGPVPQTQTVTDGFRHRAGGWSSLPAPCQEARSPWKTHQLVDMNGDYWILTMTFNIKILLIIPNSWLEIFTRYFFVGRFYGICSCNIPSGKLTVRPWQSSGLEDEFPLKMGDFQGQQVNLPSGKLT